MTAQELLSRFERNGVNIHLDNGTLRVEAPKGRVTAEVMAELRDAKPMLVEHLGALQAKPQSFGQSQLWFLDRLDPGNSIYNNPLAFDLMGDLDSGALQQALNALVERHAILRTRYLDRDGVACQRVDAMKPVDLPCHDLRPVAAETREQTAEEIRKSEAGAGFDLERDWPIRARLIRLAEQSWTFLLTIHHIAADGWSMGIAVTELAEFYGAFKANRTPDLIPLEADYLSFALDQRRQEASGEIAGAVAWWQSQLSGAPDRLDLPFDRPRSAGLKNTGAHIARVLDADIAGQLDAAALRLGVSPFAIMMSVHMLIMARNAQQTDVCTGTPLAGRNEQPHEALLGHFINTVVIRQDVDSAGTFSELARRVQARIFEAVEHQSAPLEKVVAAVNPPRSPAHAPLFQNMLIWQNTPAGKLLFDDLDVQPLETDSATAKYDLTVEVFRSGDAIRLGFEYSAALFDKTSAQMLADQYEPLLRAVLADPDALPAPEAYLSENASAKLEEWGRGPSRPLPAACAHELFAAARDRHPDALALVSGKSRLSYDALEQRSSQLANDLLAQGCRKGQIIALCAERGAEYVIGMLAISRIGAVWLPLDPDLPDARLSCLLQDAAPARILADHTGAKALQPVPTAQAQAVTRLDQPGSWQNQPSAAPDVEIAAQDPAYLLYTSGSTGRPKGVMVPHGALVNLMLWTSDSFPLGEQARVLQKTTHSFDASVWEFWWPLCAGHTMVIAEDEVVSDPARLLAFMQRHEVSAAQFVPATLELICNEAISSKTRLDIGHLFCGGGSLAPALCDLAHRAFPGVSLHNVYGPTETCVDATAYTCAKDEPPRAASVPIGRPLCNTQLEVRDATGQLLPPGAVGELWIRGAGVALGYHNLPEATADRFIECADGRAYRTGDMVRFDGAGRLHFAGRNDFQIKLHGHRIEPGEIEAQLIANGAAAAVVMVLRDRLAAFVCGPVQAQELRLSLAETLPGYMVPAEITVLAHMPLTAAGKIDRAALRELDIAVPGAVNQDNPRDQIELRLHEVWERVLSHPNIGLRDSFFDLGGTSIAAIKLVHEIKTVFGVQLPLRQMIANPTIEALGAKLRNRADAERQADDILIPFRGARPGKPRVVCIHPAGGTAFCYFSLSQALPREFGVMALQSPGLNEGEQLAPSVEAMAQTYLERIKQDLDGPVILLGLSFGGLVAHEMGRLLADGGRRDVAVVLLDTQGSEDTALRENMSTVDMAEFRDKLVRFNGTYPGISDAQIERYFRVYNHNRLCVRDYAPPPSAALTVFIQALSNLPKSALHETRRFWRARAGAGFIVRLVRGDHWEMLETEELSRVCAAVRRVSQLINGDTAQ